jgi:enoyl-CoA hydratase
MTKSIDPVEGGAQVRYACRDGVARITIDQPPVNALSLSVRRGLISAFARAAADSDVHAIVLDGAGRCFSAGGDIREFGTPAVVAAPRLTLDVHPAIENMRKPVIAAIHGVALGGGLETAMACHYRIASADAVIAFPEVGLGLIPLSGTQRLPRLLPIERAIEFILTASKRRASEFAGTALFDELTDGPDIDLYVRAHAFALSVIGRNTTHSRVSARPIVGPYPEQALLGATAKLQGDGPGSARRQALAAIAAAVDSADFDAGLQKANVICEILLASSETRDLAKRFLNVARSS